MLDFMHIEKKNFDNYFYTVLDDKSRIEDTSKSRLDMDEICAHSSGRLKLVGGLNSYDSRMALLLTFQNV